jgi:hypothetical protein
MASIDDRLNSEDAVSENDCSSIPLSGYGGGLARRAVLFAVTLPITAVPILKGAADYRIGMPFMQKVPDSALDMGLVAAGYSALFLGSLTFCSGKAKKSKEYNSRMKDMEKSRLEYKRTHPMYNIRSKEDLDYYLTVTTPLPSEKTLTLKERLADHTYVGAAALAFGTVVAGGVFACESAFYAFGYVGAAVAEKFGL